MSTWVEQSKLQGEVITIYFDFLSLMVVGESAATALCAAEVYTGVDEDPNAFLQGSAIVSGSVVQQQVQGGTVGSVFLVTCACRTTLNNIRYLQAKIAILPSSELVPDAL